MIKQNYTNKVGMRFYKEELDNENTKLKINQWTRRIFQVQEMKLSVKPSNKIEDGKHTGKITAVEYREKPYEYTDFVIEFEGKRLKYGVPTALTPDSKLGRLLKAFAVDVKVGNDIDPDEVMTGREVEFVTITLDTQRGSFPTIVSGSLKPKWM